MLSACPVLYIIAVFGYLTFELYTLTLLCKSGLTTGAQGGFLIVITVELQTLFLDSSHHIEESLKGCCLVLKGERTWHLASASDLPGIKFSNNLKHGWDSKTMYCIVKRAYQNGFNIHAVVKVTWSVFMKSPAHVGCHTETIIPRCLPNGPLQLHAWAELPPCVPRSLPNVSQLRTEAPERGSSNSVIWRKQHDFFFFPFHDENILFSK